MFLMFHLRRPDVLPVGDQGIRNAVKTQYRLRKLPDAKRLEKIARPWRPYRTLACLYLWSSLDNAPGVSRRGQTDGAAARLFLRHAEGGAAAARGHDVRVRDLEAGALEALGEVDGRAVDVLHARRVDEHADAGGVEDVVVVALLVERERVLEAGAAAALRRRRAGRPRPRRPGLP